MLLKRLQTRAGELLGNWEGVGVLAAGLFAIGLTYGWKADMAHRQGVGLHGIVAWYGKGYGNLIQYELSTLIIISLAWILGGMVLLAAAWLYQRHSAAFPAEETHSP